MRRSKWQRRLFLELTAGLVEKRLEVYPSLCSAQAPGSKEALGPENTLVGKESQHTSHTPTRQTETYQKLLSERLLSFKNCLLASPQSPAVSGWLGPSGYCAGPSRKSSGRGGPETSISPTKPRATLMSAWSTSL